MKNFQLQVCVDSVESAIAAQKAGVHQIYLCAHLMFGGATPPLSLLELVKSYVNIPVYVLLRPRLGDFIYSEFEFEQLKRDVIYSKQNFADGIMIGALTKEGNLNVPQLDALITLADGMPIFLNRCFDFCTSPFDALEAAISLGFKGIITSGLATSAIEGQHMLKSLIQASNDRIQIIASGNINADSICTLIASTHCHAFNLSAKKARFSPTIYHNPLVHLSHIPIDETISYVSSYEELLQILDMLKNL